MAQGTQEWLGVHCIKFRGSDNCPEPPQQLLYPSQRSSASHLSRLSTMFPGMSELGHDPGVDPLVRCVSYQVQGFYTKLSQTRAIRQCSLNQFICRTAQREVIQ